jgi:translation initiation factor IF-3
MDFDLLDDQYLGGFLEYPDLYDEEEYEPAPPEPKYLNGKRILANQEITAPKVRVQGREKEDLGVMDFDEAFALAQEAEVDLLMINEQGSPPVVRLINFSTYKYELDRTAKQRQKASKGVETKEVRLTPVVEPHDYQVKLKAANSFLSKGNKVKLVMNFSGRQLRFKDQGKELILKFVEDLAGCSKVDGPLNLKTSTFTVTLAPTK